MYDFYLDVYFVERLVQIYLTLRLAIRILNSSATRLRSLLGAAVGAGASTVGIFLLPQLHMRGTLLVLAALHIGIIRSGCKITQGKQLISAVFVYDCILSLESLLLKLLQRLTGLWGTGAFIGMTLLIYALLRIAISFWESLRARQGRSWTVTLYHMNKCVRVNGLYDTGNLLRDPILAKDVSVIAIEPLAELFTDNMMEFLRNMTRGHMAEIPEDMEKLIPHYISFHAVGMEGGILPVLVLEKMTLEQDGQILAICKPALAIDRNFGSSPRNYQMILNPKLVSR